MNLPAPSYERFREVYKKYHLTPSEAVPAFEAALKSFFEVEAVATFTNCFTALAMSLMYAARKGPRTVAIAGLAYRRTTDIVLWAGLRPIYIDNDPQTLAMSFCSLEDRLKTGDVGCVLFQHPMVYVCDPEKYISLCKKYDVPLIFDSVEATGSKYGDKRIGGFGMIEGFSLHPSKVINSAEGGVLTFGHLDDYNLFMEFLCDSGVANERDRRLRIFGLEPLHAMMGLASLELYPEARAKFRLHYLKYLELLQGSSFYRLIEYDEDNDPNFKSVLVELCKFECGFRDSVIEYLESYKIGARPYYAPIHSRAKNEEIPKAKTLSESYIILPIGHSVTLEDIEFICRKLLAYPKLWKGS